MMLKSYNPMNFDINKINYEKKRLNNQFILNKKNYSKILNDYFNDNMLFLDLGCGYGDFSTLIKNFKNCKYQGIDICEEYINIAKAFKTDNVDFMIGDVKNLSDIHNKYDVIFSSYLFQHLGKDIELVLKELKGILKKDGILIIYDIDKSKNIFYPPIKNVDKLYEAEKRIGKFISNDIEITKNLPDILKKNGFSLIEVRECYVDDSEESLSSLIDMINLWKSETSEDMPIVKTKLIELTEVNTIYDEYLDRISNGTFKLCNEAIIARCDTL